MRQIIFISILCSSLISYGQSLEREVISTAGAHPSNLSGSLSWTVGELVTRTVMSTNNTLTQGFQQGDLEIISMIDNNETNTTLNVYPNPVQTKLFIESSASTAQFQLLNIHGKVIQKGEIKDHTKEIDFSDLPSGIYILKINNRVSYKIIHQ